MGKTSVTGKRWQLNGKLTIRKRGRDYMRRRYLISTPYFGVYLHHILLPDQDRGPHDHPWSFWTFVLKGWYEEGLATFKRPLDERDAPPQHPMAPPQEIRRHNRFSLKPLRMNQTHRITRLSRGGAWTLCFVGPRRREWGFWVPEEGWIRWDLETNRGEEVFD